MVEYNPDGSLKLPAYMVKDLEDKEQKMKNSRCLLIKKEVVDFTAPKKCILHLKLSEKMTDNRFVVNIHNEFSQTSSTPTKIIKSNEKEFDIVVGTHFKRCSECTLLTGRYKEFMNENMILEKGNCTYAGRSANFTYDDYFE